MASSKPKPMKAKAPPIPKAPMKPKPMKAKAPPIPKAPPKMKASDRVGDPEVAFQGLTPKASGPVKLKSPMKGTGGTMQRMTPRPVGGKAPTVPPRKGLVPPKRPGLPPMKGTGTGAKKRPGLMSTARRYRGGMPGDNGY